MILWCCVCIVINACCFFAAAAAAGGAVAATADAAAIPLSKYIEDVGSGIAHCDHSYIFSVFVRARTYMFDRFLYN